jgi:hypothetical protein
MDRQHDGSGQLSAVLWLGLPLASVAVALLSPLGGWDFWWTCISSEQGLFETGTVLFLVPTAILSFRVFLRRRLLPRGFGWYMLVLALAAVYFAGEEASWGQHWLGFRTPQAWAEENRQGEFNLHNLRALKLLNEVPRLGAQIAVTVFGVILPLWVRRRRRRPGAERCWWYWAVPTAAIVPTAFLAAFWTVPEKFFRAADYLPSYVNMALCRRAGEFKEYCIAMTMMLYAVSIHLRLPARSKAALAPSARD